MPPSGTRRRLRSDAQEERQKRVQGVKGVQAQRSSEMNVVSRNKDTELLLKYLDRKTVVHSGALWKQ